MKHQYNVWIKWTGNQGQGTRSYQAYSRDHIISIPDKNDIYGSSDPAFRGDKSKHNPEELLVSALSTCHMLWYLHLCAQAGVVVIAYEDQALGVMEEEKHGGGRFIKVTLNPIVTVANTSMVSEAERLHHKANELCFIANSVNFPVMHQALTLTADEKQTTS